MPINVACPQCRRQFVVRDEIAGKSFRCKDCEAVISVPLLKPTAQKSSASESSASEASASEVSAPKWTSVAKDPPAEEDWGYDTWQDDQQPDLPAPARRVKRKPAPERNDDLGEAPFIPIEGMLSIASIAVLGVLNLWVLISPDAILWKLIAAIRIAVEARVVWGIRVRNSQTGLAATIAAVMMTLISALMLWRITTDPEIRAEVSPEELRNGLIFLMIQTVAEIGVIVGLNLPRTRRWMATGHQR